MILGILSRDRSDRRREERRGLRERPPSGISGFLSLLVPVLAFASALSVREAAAQDVELWGALNGTRPPDAYHEERARNPRAYEFRRALTPRLDRALAARGGFPFERPPLTPLELGRGAPARVVLGPRVGVVQGDFRFPVVQGLFADSDTMAAPPPVEEVRREFFDGPSSRFGTIPDFYREVSGGRVEIRADVFDWLPTTLTMAEVGRGSAGLASGSGVAPYIKELLVQLDDAGIDWGLYDNDGPDGIPNSGDDDGFVDILILMQPGWGAECENSRSSNRIWSHRWNLTDRAGAGNHYTTRTPSNAPGTDYIRIDDYAIQGAVQCPSQGGEIAGIGVMAHELGHGFGLPDLYGTGDQFIPGAGGWDLMATGSYGCGNASPSRPCHLGAWSKAVLGWVEVETLAPDVDHGEILLPPVREEERVLQLPSGDGSDEFFLLETRMRTGFDATLPAEGLLVWQIAPALIGDRRTPGTLWQGNRINSLEEGRPAGVWLRQADGRNDLLLPGSGGNRGDAGDPFPGTTGNTAFHAATLPGSITHGGDATGVTLLDIRHTPEGMRFRVQNRFRELALDALGPGGAPLPGEAFRVGDRTVAAGEQVRVASFDRIRVEALPGVATGPDARLGFSEWADGDSRIRTVTFGTTDIALAARFDRPEVRLEVDLLGAPGSVAPGEIRFTPGDPAGWVPVGEPITILAEALRGFSFREWGGAFAGRSNPFTLTVTEPLRAEAHFDLRYGTDLPDSLVVEAAAETDLPLALAHATPPLRWQVVGGALPEGLRLEEDGLLHGVALEDGLFAPVLRIEDGSGLSVEREVVLRIEIPDLPIDALLLPFLLSGEEPTDAQMKYLDRMGNRNGYYDLGDLRRYLRRLEGEGR